MPYPLSVSTARNQWKELFVAVNPNVAGFYLFEFRDEQAEMQVLEGGPYFFSQKYLVLKDWHRMMNPAQDQPSKISAWVKLHDLLFELWNQECLSRVASTIGKPLHVDQATAKIAKQLGLLHTKSRLESILRLTVISSITPAFHLQILTLRELSDSEDEMFQVLEGVVSSNQGVGALNQHLRTKVSLVKVQSELKTSQAPEPPDPLGSGVKREAAKLVSKGSAVFNKYLSKTAKKRLKNQAKKELINHSSKSRNK
ncbi:hypothetical protein RHMOL_Rhmol04G0157600 [Rhododendron molle]|uniref:Uncharacterized protein n=1 Tax=Rhododendron molle TaxID=49168 RepID=A0ACC0P248_RHOML|nr:hypothetical protein RHMOL_Rhmol04G0157600 [Rhododendron molle]